MIRYLCVLTNFLMILVMLVEVNWRNPRVILIVSFMVITGLVACHAVWIRVGALVVIRIENTDLVCFCVSQMLGQSSWLEDVGHSINDRTRTTLEVLYRLIDSGKKLEKASSESTLVPFHPDCVTALNKLRAEMDRANSVEKRATTLLTERWLETFVYNYCHCVLLTYPLVIWCCWLGNGVLASGADERHGNPPPR